MGLNITHAGESYGEGDPIAYPWDCVFLNSYTVDLTLFESLGWEK